MKIVISGDSKGLGYELCKNISGKFEVVGFSRKPKIKNDDKWKHFKFDLDDYKNILNKENEKLREELLSSDVLIHNAAIPSNNLIVVEPDSIYQKVMKINVFAPVYLTKLWIKNKLLHDKTGHLLFISSICTKKHFKGLSAYAMSKSAIESFSKTISVEMSSRGIRSNLVLPGYMETSMTEGLTSEQLDKIKNRTPMKRLADIDEICTLIEYLITDGTFINGAEIVIDGGYTL